MQVTFDHVLLNATKNKSSKVATEILVQNTAPFEL